MLVLFIKQIIALSFFNSQNEEHIPELDSVNCLRIPWLRLSKYKSNLEWTAFVVLDDFVLGRWWPEPI